MKYDAYLSEVDRFQEELCNISDTLWDNPETGYQEFMASALLADTLEKHGFTVERGVAGIATAFTAVYGQGRPVIGIQAEYDALDGISQAADVVEKTPVPGKTKGHGCGHNLFAGGSLGAALAVKAYVEKTGCGMVKFFGCPAEEGGGGKVFMVRDGVYEGVDAIVSWHPEKMYMVRTRPALANVKVVYEFEGITAHAGANPQKGRSALDAAELMNIGVNFLREHMDTTSRIHYAFLNVGGTAPNVVQAEASLLYMIRATDSAAVRELQGRVDRIAQGAAMMTDTKVSIKVVSGYSDLITIPTLQAVANEALHDIPLPMPTDEDLAYAQALQKTMVMTAAEKAMPPYALTVLDPAPPVSHGGSTDTADVSWVCPTVQMHIGNWIVGTAGHSWQSTVQSRSSYAKRSMLFAAKAVAATVMRLFDDPLLLAQAKQEHAEKTAGGYVCPIPADAVPAVWG